MPEKRTQFEVNLGPNGEPVVVDGTLTVGDILSFPQAQAAGEEGLRNISDAVKRAREETGSGFTISPDHVHVEEIRPLRGVEHLQQSEEDEE